MYNDFIIGLCDKCVGKIFVILLYSVILSHLYIYGKKSAFIVGQIRPLSMVVLLVLNAGIVIVVNALLLVAES